MEAMEFIQTFLSICGGISIIGGAIAVVWKLVKPATEFSKRVDKLEKHEIDFYKKQDEMKGTIDAIAATQKEIIRIQLSILNHEITGNGVDEMKKIRDELTDLIVK